MAKTVGSLAEEANNGGNVGGRRNGDNGVGRSAINSGGAV